MVIRAWGALARRLPLVAPGLAATAVFCLIISWNEFLFALVLTQTDDAMTLPVGIAGRVTQYGIKWGVMSAAASRGDDANPRVRIERAKISGQRTVAGSSERVSSCTQCQSAFLPS